ncbi:hypothetical protein AAL_02022 [Moelleriella libera RCEF 2490]|uniref:Uncharacterized protein n=1 Tax=Moelleriella libera RCEF 2490 TaxID=1081109 RepID=A0A166PW50_9HYPO|nr:hypothetical protein AAL_02022 [Moelleriella libera RCEF 2490]
MPPPPSFPDLGTSQELHSSPYEPSQPSLSSSASTGAKVVEVQPPPQIAGSLVTALATFVADQLGNELFTHYYQGEQKPPTSLDRVVDRLLSEFTKKLGEELHRVYQEPGAEPPSPRVTLLFEGPIPQLMLVLNGPEAAKCMIDKLGPGLSQRKASWPAVSAGVDLAQALQLLCHYWHREKPSQSPPGSPDDIAQDLHRKIVQGTALGEFTAAILRLLMTPHYVQAHASESAMWHIITMRPSPPPADGYHILDLMFRCQLFGPLDGTAPPQPVEVGSLPAVTGTAEECVDTTVTKYTEQVWPRNGPLILRCLNEAIRNAATSYRHGKPTSGLAVWDASGDSASPNPGIRLIHVELGDAVTRLALSSRPHHLVAVFQQMCWLCAALSTSPFPGALSECTCSVSDWKYAKDSTYINCHLEHQPVPDCPGPSWLRQREGPAIARGFPLYSSALTPLECHE